MAIRLPASAPECACALCVALLELAASAIANREAAAVERRRTMRVVEQQREERPR
jgi:hypothetical protein